MSQSRQWEQGMGAAMSLHQSVLGLCATETEIPSCKHGLFIDSGWLI